MDLIGTRTLRDLLEEREQQDPDKLFLVHEDTSGTEQRQTYGEFVATVRRTAAGLSDLGVGHGDAIGIHLGNCPEFLHAWLGAAWIGAIAVPSNTANTHSELRHVLEHSEAVAVVTSPDFRELVHGVADELPGVRHLVIARTDDAAANEITLSDLQTRGSETGPCSQTDVFELIFTSGTTARPKAVMLTHANALRSGERAVRSLGVDRDDRLLTALPVFHANAQSTTLLAGLTAGATVVLLEEYRASRFWEQVRSHHASVISLVAMQLRTLLVQPDRPTDRDHHVRRTFYAINVSDREKDDFERRYGVDLINGYGLSEALTLVTIAPLAGPRRWPSIGRAVFDREIRIVDTEGRDCAPGELGEILVGGVPGRTLMQGYFRDPQATAEVLRDGWLRTGDNGSFDEQGYVYFYDRQKDVIKRAGENVSATEVEAALTQHPAVAEAGVVGVPDPIRDEAVLAFVALEPGAELSTDELLAHAGTLLSSFKVPTIVEFRTALPKTSVGKIEKKLLREEARGLVP